MSVHQTPTFLVCFIDSNAGAADIGPTLIRCVKRHLPGVRVQVYVTQTAFKNAVHPTAQPDVLVLSHRQAGQSVSDFVAGLRREGFGGRVYLYTGGGCPDDETSRAVDGVFHKTKKPGLDDLCAVIKIDLEM